MTIFPSRPFAACFLSILFVGLLGPSSVSLAQTDRTGRVSGTIRLSDGSAVPGVTVLAERGLGGEWVALSDEAGRFVYGSLLPGGYRISAEMDGMDPAATQVRVSAGTHRTVELVIGLEAITDSLTVTAERPLIETATSEQTTLIGETEVELLPTSRTATDLVKLTPGGSNGALWGGSTSQANSYRLDGVSVNQPGFGGDFLLPNVDWIEELQVRGLGAGAEYGNFQGGAINIVTKSGGNDLRGSVRLNLEDASLNASNLNSLEVGEEDDSRLEANFDLSGPLVEDRVFYFVSLQHVESKINILDLEASTPSEVRFLGAQEEREEIKLLSKITWQPTDGGLLTGLLGFDRVETDNRGLSSFVAPEAAERQESPATFYSLGWTGTVSNRTVYELELTGYSGDDDRLPKNGDLPSVRILGGDRETFRNSVFSRLQTPESNALAASFDHLFTTGSWSHQLKIGGELEDGSWNEQRIRNGGFTWRPEEGEGPFDPNDPSTWGFVSSDWGSGIHLDAETTNAALYVQDYIDIGDRLRLSAGLRYGLWQGDLSPGFGDGDAFTAIDAEAFDPRLGLVWDVAGDGRFVAKAHWGRYHQNLFALLFDRALGGSVFQDEEYWDWIGSGLPDPNRIYTLEERESFFELFDTVATGREVGPVADYDQPHVDQLVLSFEYLLNDAWKLGLTYVNRENDDIVALVDRNLANNYTLFRNVGVIDFRSGDPVLGADGNPLVLDEIFVGNDDILRRGWAPGLTAQQIAALTFDQDLVLTNAPGARREMDQFQLVLDGRSERFDLHASLVHTDLEGDFYSVSGYDDPGGTGAGSFVNPNEQIRAFGPLEGSSEWVLKLRLTAELPWNLRAGLYLEHATGEPYTPFYTIDNRNHDFVAENGEFFGFRHFSNVNGEDIFLEDRGSRELPDTTLVDLHLDRVFELGGTSLVLGFDVFNLLAEDAVRDVVETVNFQDASDPTTLFGAAERRVTPRTTRLYASLRW